MTTNDAHHITETDSGDSPHRYFFAWNPPCVTAVTVGTALCVFVPIENKILRGVSKSDSQSAKTSGDKR